jgi:hypothetical protein
MRVMGVMGRQGRVDDEELSGESRGAHRAAVPLATVTGRAGQIYALVLVLAVSVALEVHPAAAACPSCEPGRQARSEVWNEDFGTNLLVAALPFLVIAGICLRVEAIGRSRKPRAPRPTTEAGCASRWHEPTP